MIDKNNDSKPNSKIVCQELF